jgi:hypothetical protein
MLSCPVLSEKVAMVSRPIVEAPFMIDKSQNVSRGLLLGSISTIGVLDPSRVP